MKPYVKGIWLLIQIPKVENVLTLEFLKINNKSLNHIKVCLTVQYIHIPKQTMIHQNCISEQGEIFGDSKIKDNIYNLI